MSSEVTLPLAATLTDLATRRLGERSDRPDQGGSDAAPREDRTPFGALVRNEAAPERPADRSARRRQPQAERLVPGQLSKADKAVEANEIDREPRAGRKADRKDDEATPRRADERRRDGDASRSEAKSEAGREPEARDGEEPVEKAADAVEAPEETKAEAPATEEAAPEDGETDIDASATIDADLTAPAASTLGAIVAGKTAGAAPGTPGTATGIDADGAGTITDPALAAELARLAAKAAAKTGQASADGEAAGPDAETSATKTRSPVADAAEAAREARTESGKPGIGEAVSDAAKGAKGTDGGPAQARTTQLELHPTRAPIFAELLETFHGSSIHRPADILAGLDRTIGGGTHARPEAASRPTPLQMLPIEIGMQAVRGATNFQIRLDPAELGRIDVKLQIRENGEVHASLVVDRVETLAMLRRDASTLQQAFEQAGLRQSADGLSFSLRGEGQHGEGNEKQGRGQGRQDAIDEAALNATPAEVAMRRVLIPNASIDRMI